MSTENFLRIDETESFLIIAMHISYMIVEFKKQSKFFVMKGVDRKLSCVAKISLVYFCITRKDDRIMIKENSGEQYLVTPRINIGKEGQIKKITTLYE